MGRLVNRLPQCRAAPPCLTPEFHLNDGTVLPAKPNLPARARRDEIVGACDRWSVERKAAHDACGLTATIAEQDAANEANRELRHRIMATPALTMAGVMLKARIAGWCFGGVVGMDDYIESYLNEGNLSDEARHGGGQARRPPRHRAPDQDLMPWPGVWPIKRQICRLRRASSPVLSEPHMGNIVEIDFQGVETERGAFVNVIVCEAEVAADRAGAL